MAKFALKNKLPLTFSIKFATISCSIMEEKMNIDGLIEVVIAFVLTLFLFGVLINIALIPLPKSWQAGIKKAGKNGLVAVWNSAWSLVFWIIKAPFIGLWRAIRRARR